MNDLEWLKQDYLNFYKEQDCKYIVLKMEDLLGSIETLEDWQRLQTLLEKYNKYRETLGKGVNKYFVANRDDYPPLETAEEFKDALEAFINMAV